MMMIDVEPIKVCAFGGTSQLSQIDRITQGLSSLKGVEINNDLRIVDLIYSNDPGYFEAILSAKDQNLLKENCKIIFNVLDLPLHLIGSQGDYSFEKLAKLGAQLLRADAVTCISQYTQSQLQQCLGVGSVVIYNPVKPVSPDKRLNEEKPFPYRVLMAGRLNDTNKRARSLAIPALMRAGFEEHEVAVVGGEYPGWGVNLGIVNDSTLNDLYNSVDFVMCCSHLEGWGLTISESVICGAIPIVCQDLTTASEMSLPQYWFCYPSPEMIAFRLRVLIENPSILRAERDYCLSLSEGLSEDLSKETVARRIIEVYKKLFNKDSHE